MKKTIFSLLLSFVAFAASAANFFIDYDSGSDAAAGTSTATAWKYFPLDSRATGTSDAKSLAAGDVFIFKGGVTYYMPTNLTAFDLTTSGTAGNHIVLDGDSGKYASRWGSGTNRAVLDGNDVTTIFVDGTARSYWKVNGFEMRNGGYGTTAVVIDNGGAWEVTDNYIHEFYDWDLESGSNKLGSYIRSVGTGIRIDDAAEVLVMGNEVTKVGGVGIGVGYPVTNIVVATNYIHDYIVWFIDISTFSTYSSSNIVVRDNLLKNLFHYSQSYWDGAIPDEKLNYSIEENPHEDGIFIRQPGSSGSIQNLQIYNNTFVNDVEVTENGGTAWLFTSEIRAGSSIYIYNNLFQNAYANDHMALGWNQNDDYSIKVYHNTFAGVGNCVQITEYKTNTTHAWHVLNNIFDSGVGLGPGLSSVGTCATLYGALTSDYNLFSNQGTLGYAVSGAGCNYQNTLAQWQAASSDDANSITGSAGFVSLVLDALSSTSNLRLSSSSDAIGAGFVLDPAIYPGADYDRLGRYRGTTGAVTDLGAYVYNAADGTGPTIVTNNASGSRVMGFRGIGMSVFPIPSVNTTADLWQTFEFTDPTVANLTANDNTSTGTWLTNDNTVLISTSTTGERALLGTVNGSADTGHARGLAKSHTANDTSNVQFDLGSGNTKTTISAGVWFKFVGSTPNVNKTIIDFSNSGGEIIEVNMEGTTKMVGFQGGGNNGVALVSGNFYWITAQVTHNATSYVKVYDTTGAQVGTEVSATAGNQTIRYISLGDTINESADNSILTYWDDLVLDWTDATYPLGL